MENNGERLTFYSIFKEKKYSVEIPIIQRDYAHGRISESKIRNNFLKDLYNSLKNDKSIDLDFIYGSIADGKFIPLDGQQRLTTLFLLHWYIASKEGKLGQFRNILTFDNKSRFSYETRITSRDFCTALVNNNIVIPSSSQSSLSNVIKDAPWFFISWKKDPTISSMLVVLDAIHDIFAETTNFYEKLSNSDNPLISFQFIELEHFGLSDNLYVKMNARGKELTTFENFKAKFEQLLEQVDKDNNSNLKAEFSLKIDSRDWTDIFWKYRDPNTQLFDEKIMNFIQILAANRYALKSDDKSSTKKNLGELINYSLNFDDFLKIGCFDFQFIDQLIKTFDTLKNGDEGGIKLYLLEDQLFDEVELFQKAIAGNMTYTQRIQFFALYNYLIQHGKDDQLVDWIRIIRNLTENTVIDDISGYLTALKSVNEMLPFGGEILSYLANQSTKIKGFLGIQVQEERLKALLIIKSEKWKDAIIQIENHGYFKGQIGFILDFSRIADYFKENGNLNWTENEGQEFYQRFFENSIKAGLIFKNSGLNKFDDFLFERVLMCKGNYLLDKRKNYSFLIDSDRVIGWKRLLRDDTKNRGYLKELFNDIGTSEIEKDLQKIISNTSISDWRKYFVEYPEIIRACGYYKFIRWYNEKNILLLEKTQTNGYHSEYYSFAFKIILEKMGNRVYYHGDSSVDNLKYISYINGHEIKIYYQNGRYVFENSGKISYYDSQDDLIARLKEENIVIPENKSDL